ncbi:MAG: MBL fold metallo-hydrolase [Ignavibacteriae bacterium]|nr:MBL fold metallo-hydrolase [Ignavibacteriota bacterium]
MKIILVGSGTSQGVPNIGCKCETCLSDNPKDKRLRASAYVETGGLKILIDTSIDFRQQMLRANISDLDAVLFTHHHVDHILGMDDLRQINQRHRKYIDIYGNKLTLDEIKISFRYALDEELKSYWAVPLVNFHYTENKAFKIRGIEVLPVEVYHGKIKIYGYRIGNLAYITDASKIPDREMEKLEGLDVLILNALRRAPHPTHFNLEQATEIALRLKARKTYFTHITHDMMHDKINSELPENIELGYDGLTIEI